MALASRKPARPRARGRVRLCVVAVCLAAVAAVAACRTPTEITIELSTDVKCADVRGTAITIGDLTNLDAKPSTTVTPACDPQTGRIGSMVIVPSGSKDDTVAIKVVMGVGRDPAECVPPAYGPGCIVARRALHFIPSSSLTVPIFMGAVCSGIPCDATQTCVRGACTGATIDDPSKCEAAGGCGESALGPTTVSDGGVVPDGSVVPDGGVVPDGSVLPDGSVVPDSGVAPCPANTVCEVVASTTVYDVAVSATALFWLDSTGKVMTAALDGTNQRALVTGEQAPLAGIEANAQSVYWTSNGQLRHAGASDGAGPASLANVQGGCLKWMTAGLLLAAAPGVGNIYSVNVSNGSLTLVTTGASNPWGVAAQGFNDFFYSNFDLGRIRKGDGGTIDPNPIIVSNQSGPRCIVTDGTSLWWANNGSGALVKSTTAGASIQQLVAGQTSISGVALDATWVYWSWQGGIRKRTK